MGVFAAAAAGDAAMAMPKNQSVSNRSMLGIDGKAAQDHVNNGWVAPATDQMGVSAAAAAGDATVARRMPGYPVEFALPAFSNNSSTGIKLGLFNDGVPSVAASSNWDSDYREADINQALENSMIFR